MTAPLCGWCEAWLVADVAKLRLAIGKGTASFVAQSERALSAAGPGCSCGQHVDQRGEFEQWISREGGSRILDAYDELQAPEAWNPTGLLAAPDLAGSPAAPGTPAALAALFVQRPEQADE